MPLEHGYYHQEHYDYKHQNVSSTAMSEDEVFYYVVMIIHVVLVPVYIFLIGYFSYKLCIQPAKRKKMTVVLGTLNHAVKEEINEDTTDNENIQEDHDPLSPDTSLIQINVGIG